jgi:histone H1/5
MRIPILTLGALVACLSLAVSAQTPPPEPPKPAPPKVDAKKADAKKTDAKKVVAKKDEAKKPAAKKPPAKPAVAKKPAPAKTAAPPQKPVEIRTMNTDKPLVLRDKDGNIIPTSPDAYNVDSALPPKKR